MPPEYKTPDPPIGKAVFGRLATVAAVFILTGFAGWCLLDFFYVRYELRDSVPLSITILLVYPAAAFYCSLRASRSLLLGTRIQVAFGWTMLVCVACLAAILYFGLSFHFWIGGRI